MGPWKPVRATFGHQPPPLVETLPLLGMALDFGSVGSLVRSGLFGGLMSLSVVALGLVLLICLILFHKTL